MRIITLIRFKTVLPAIAVLALATAACGSSEVPGDVEGSVVASSPTAGPADTPVPPTPIPPTHTPKELYPLQDSEVAVANRLEQLWDWDTDFSKKTINLLEIDVLLSRDQIQPIDDPSFAPVVEAPSYMRDREPVISLEINGEARAYPLAMLMWHEIVNDTVGGVPVTVTFCPLCNSAVVFERMVGGDELTFGTTGALRNSDLVMWDRQTQSWWQQFTGEAIVGEYAGRGAELKPLPSAVVAWETFKETYPEGAVLERIFDERGFPVRSYDRPPYAGYDSVDNANPFAFDGPVDGRLPAAARVLTLEHGGKSVAYPFTFLESNPVLNDRLAGLDFVAFFDSETLSAFVDELGDQQRSGSVTVFKRELDGQVLDFEIANGKVRDIGTGSVWSVAGSAVEGPLTGSKLEPVIHREDFWFAWSVFKPETELRGVS